MEIPVERYIEQVVDGSHYKGYIKFFNNKIDYELVFGVPIPQFERVVSDEKEIRRLFQIKVKKRNLIIYLTKDEYDFFLAILVPFALEFYNDQQTRDSQEGTFGMAVRNGFIASLDVSASVGMTSNGTYGFPPEVSEMLHAEKFG